MCIDVAFVKGLCVHMIDKLDNAKQLSKEGMEKNAAMQHQLIEACKTYELLKQHMGGVYFFIVGDGGGKYEEEVIDLDALVHSVL